MNAADLSARSRAAVWHPCTQMARLDATPPLPIARGEGPWLIDTDGKRYFDANSSWWVNLFGHSDAGLRAALTEQLHTLPHVMLAGCTHEPAVRLAERLTARTGAHLGHAFFASDGASATEIALKMSFHAWRELGAGDKREFICLRNGYHGETLGALAVTDVQIFRDAYDPLLMRAHTVLAPDTRLDNEAAALADLDRVLNERAGRVAALILEPLVQCAAGMVMHTPSFLRAVRARCTAAGVHLIVDEIAVGCGRTGRFFAWEHTQSQDWPDFITLSKGITGGTVPLSLVLTTDAVFNAFWHPEVARGFLHSHSYSGNPMACAAANAVLDWFDAPEAAARLAEQARLLAGVLTTLAVHPRVHHVRQRGSIAAFDVTDAPAGFAERFHLAARAHGLLIRPIGHTVYLMPPYLLNAELAVMLGQALAATLDEVLHAA